MLHRNRFLCTPKGIEIIHILQNMNDGRLAPALILLGEGGRFEVFDVVAIEANHAPVFEGIEDDERDVFDDIPVATKDRVSQLSWDRVHIDVAARVLVKLYMDVLRIPPDEPNPFSISVGNVPHRDSACRTARRTGARELVVRTAKVPLPLAYRGAVLALLTDKKTCEGKVNTHEGVTVSVIVEVDLHQPVFDEELAV